jgi:uncharacterized membrane protein
MFQILVCALAGAMLYQRAAIWCRRGFWNAFLSTVEKAGARTCRRLRNESPRCTYIACCKKLLQMLFVFFLNYQRISIVFIKYNPPLSISVGCVVCSYYPTNQSVVYEMVTLYMVYTRFFIYLSLLSFLY